MAERHGGGGAEAEPEEASSREKRKGIGEGGRGGVESAHTHAHARTLLDPGVRLGVGCARRRPRTGPGAARARRALRRRGLLLLPSFLVDYLPLLSFC